ncbi:hypothetical protein NDU88_003857 [Pleurodeles waltl]|uniref:Uncharacterized protein n=1 Tax=Pleurodeles waltl TaxID=8319 RepID=A0AAV7KZN4_PLEWA|nr:hypothetical protein NDU88_003857 [Pleurodeles waltl]
MKDGGRGEADSARARKRVTSVDICDADVFGEGETERDARAGKGRGGRTKEMSEPEVKGQGSSPEQPFIEAADSRPAHLTFMGVLAALDGINESCSASAPKARGRHGAASSWKR